ncbi:MULTISPECIES: phage tail protein [unclassified Pseudomonas]|uniref:phage tail protein n=1 Tax=unclassified Pseudomonas TaxID=196821 RepID=UPI0024499D5F|nr:MULTISPECIES: phage tail protein [unclassified Pseudomonas]MDH0894352.1 phage tail protein [Pseudomonas sp. GD03875]MDH1063353.1 phage tail protein [Pseudomonas sp. GD03985]
MFALLGDIEFELAGGLVGMEWRETSDWAEHARIAGKPLLEWVGDGLAEYSLEIQFHPMLGDPEVRRKELKKAKDEHQPLKLVLGNGEYPGAYVITDMSVSPRRSMGDGRLFSGSIRITLREFVGALQDQASPRGLIPAGLAGTNMAALASPDVQATPTAPASVARQVLEHARSAATVLRSGLELYEAAQVLRSNPAAVLGRVPRLLDATRAVLAPLGDYADAAGVLDGGGDLVSAASGALADVLTARSWLSPINAGNVLERVEAAGGALERAAGRLGEVDVPLAQLAAAVVTRRA